jgi:hypothetical protein
VFPGWDPLDLTLDSNDLTRLNGCDAREAGGRATWDDSGWRIPSRLAFGEGYGF